MNTIRVDVAVIGAGTAGLSAYRAARMRGKRVLLIENGHYGTTCARVGCMPSKLLIAASDMAHGIAAAPAFGVFSGVARIDGAAVMARVRSERDRFVAYVLEGMDKIPAQDKIQGHARFAGPHELRVDQHSTIHAERIVIATGSTALMPQEWTQVGERVISSDDVFDWADLPASVAVIGSGVIGLELGQALHRLGVRVSIFARSSRLAQLSDPVVLQSADRILASQLDIRFQTQVLGIVRGDAELVLTSREGAKRERVERFNYVLVAVGRCPNVQDLGLGLAQIAIDGCGVPLYNKQTMQCGDSAIFIAGDANDEHPVQPEAADQGRIAGDNAGRYPDVVAGLRRTPLTIAFTDPQIATLGASYKDLCRTHAARFGIGSLSFETQGRSRVMRQNHGLLRVYGELGTDLFLGAEMIGPRAEHLSHLLAWACQARMTVTAMLDMPYYHPVLEEGVRSALRDLAANLEPQAVAPEPCPDCTPGT